MIAQAQVDAVSSQLADLEAELREYEAIREGKFQVEELSVVADLPSLLIKARIAGGLSQRELADRMGLKEQQIQRYEARITPRPNGPASGRWLVCSAWKSVAQPSLRNPITEGRSIGILSVRRAMKQLNDSSDVRNQGLCIHCGEGLHHGSRSRNHIPTRALLDRPYPD